MKRYSAQIARQQRLDQRLLAGAVRMAQADREAFERWSADLDDESVPAPASEEPPPGFVYKRDG